MLDMIIDKIKHNKLITALLAIIVALLVGLYLLSYSLTSKEADFPDFSQTSEQVQLLAEAKQETTTSSLSEDLTVDIKGAVKKEGVYTLSTGSRITDLIKLAGGFSDQADKKSVNLAQKLTDEAVVYVASQGENISVIDKATPSQAALNSETGSVTSDKVGLNSASLADLQTISGIGAKRAQDIIDYRDSQGGFSSLDQLKEVSGIGDKTFDKLKDMVSLD